MNRKPIPGSSMRNPPTAAHRPVIQPKPATPVWPTTPGAYIGAASVIQETRGPRGAKKGGAKKAQRRAVVTLTISGRPYPGESSGQYGHAEMQALRRFIISKPSVADALRILRGRGRKTVTCPNQPVCGSCKRILEAFGFQAAPGTVLSNRKSGGVAWGANIKVRELMELAGEMDTYRAALAAGAR